jgi:hypothetical protein
MARIFVLFLAATPLGGSAVLAQECVAPCTGHAFKLELTGEWINDPGGAGSATEIQPVGTLEIFGHPRDALYFHAAIVAESLSERNPGESLAFSDLGVYLAELYGEADIGAVTLRFGKFDPEFGLVGGGIDDLYGTDLVEDYDTDERIGFRVAFPFEALGLANAVTFAAFSTDRSFLSQSIGSKREQLTLEDGGAGNTGGLGSFSAVYDICAGVEDAADCAEDGDLGARLGLRWQGAGRPTDEQITDGVSPKDEVGLLGAISRRFELGGGHDLNLLLEAAYFSHFETNSVDAVFATGAISLRDGPLTYTTTATQRTNKSPDSTDRLLALGVAYEPDRSISSAVGLKIEAGYEFLDSEDDGTSHRLGTRVSFSF